MSSLRKPILALCCAGAFSAVAFTCVTARAQVIEPYGGMEDRSWRREDRTVYESPQHWAFELRFGSYKPQVDDEFDTSPGPYETIFGNSGRLYLGFELDYQALRIPYVGTLGGGFSWGYTRMNGNGILTQSGQPAAEEVSLWIMPMYLAAVVRIDTLAEHTVIPLVPYAKVGVGYALWQSTNELGTSRANDVLGRGTSYGLHTAGGVMLRLDMFDAHAARQLDNSVGVNHSYVFFEWMRNGLDGFGAGDVMQVGTSTWVLGLAFEI